MAKIHDVTACLVTRGDQPEQMEAIRESLIFEKVVVWDNSIEPDWKTAGRYAATRFALTPFVYYQDDDVIVPAETQRTLLWAARRGWMIANWGHGDDPDGYEDLPLVCGGAIVDTNEPWKSLDRYLRLYPADNRFLYEADFIAGVLYESWRHLRLPFEINMEIAQAPERLCNQPWQRELKLEVTNRAREIRDAAA